MESLFANNFPGLFTTYGDYIVHACQQELCEVRLLVVAIRVNCAAEHLCRVAILNPFQESYLPWRANTDKLLRENNKQPHDKDVTKTGNGERGTGNG